MNDGMVDDIHAVNATGVLRLALDLRDARRARGPGSELQSEGQELDLCTEAGVQAAVLELFSATKATGAAPDFSVYLLVFTANMVNQLKMEGGGDDNFAACIYSAVNLPLMVESPKKKPRSRPKSKKPVRKDVH